MSYWTKDMLTDRKGRIIPQTWDPVKQAFVETTPDMLAAVEKFDELKAIVSGTLDVNQYEPGLVEQKTDADGSPLSFLEPLEYVEIYNRDTTNDGVFNVNGTNITVPSGIFFKAKVKGTPSTEVTVTGSTSYIVGRYV